jgi:hypothetical protein
MESNLQTNNSVSGASSSSTTTATTRRTRRTTRRRSRPSCREARASGPRTGAAYKGLSRSRRPRRRRRGASLEDCLRRRCRHLVQRHRCRRRREIRDEICAIAELHSKECFLRVTHSPRKREDWAQNFRNVMLRHITVLFTTMTVVQFPCT